MEEDIELLEHGGAEAMRTAVCALVQDMIDKTVEDSSGGRLDPIAAGEVVFALLSVRTEVSRLKI